MKQPISLENVEYSIALLATSQTSVTWTLSPVPPPMPMRIQSPDSPRHGGVLMSREVAWFTFTGSGVDTLWFLEWEESSAIKGHSVLLWSWEPPQTQHLSPNVGLPPASIPRTCGGSVFSTIKVTGFLDQYESDMALIGEAPASDRIMTNYDEFSSLRVSEIEGRLYGVLFCGPPGADIM